MKTLVTGIALLALASAPSLVSPPVARATCVYSCGMGSQVHFRDRYDASDARLAITNRSGKVSLLLTDRDVVFQLSDREMRMVTRELRHAREDHDNVIANAIASVVTNTVQEVLEHSMVCHVSDLRDVVYRDGRLAFIGRHGRTVFYSGRHCGDDDEGMNQFSEDDAQEFIREFHKVKAGQ